jgi:TolB-like protein/class 3 adenylate cyclase
MPPVRRLTAILAADVAGYSRLMGTDEEGTHERLKAHLGELVNPKIAEHRGRIVKNTGDGFLAEFQSVVDAVKCAVEVQQGMADRNLPAPPEKRIDFRVGINLGDVIAEEHDIFGDGVNVAARLEALAEPGRICVSRVVRDQIRDKLDFAFEDMGEQSVKNIARPVRVYGLRPEGTAGVPTTTISSAASSSPAVAAPRLSIVVLPFTNLSNDPEQQYFADGITEDLTTDLSRITQSFVISRNTAFTYRNKTIDTRLIGRELGVRYVLQGSLRRSGSQVRVSAQLIDAATDAHLWADRFDRDTGDLFALQNEITGRLANALGVELIAADSASRRARLHSSRAFGVIEAPDAGNPQGGHQSLRARIGARSAIRRSTEPIGRRTGGQRDHGNEQPGFSCLRHRARGRTGRSSPSGVATLCASACRQRPCLACSEPMAGGHSRIRSGARIGSQLRGRVHPSRLVQALLRLDRRGDPAH